MRSSIISVAIVLCSIHLYAQTANVPSTPSSPSSAASLPLLEDFYNPGSLRNFVRTYTVQEPTTTPSNILGPNTFYIGIAAASSGTSYFDGLGRPLQNVQYAAIKNGNYYKDIVTPYVYDANGRPALSYKPYSTTSSGKLKTTPKSQMQSFYNSLYFGEQPYSKTVYDGSPLNREAQKLQPGRNLVGSNRGTSITYDVNTNTTTNNTWFVDHNIYRYTISNTGLMDPVILNGMYTPGELDVNQTEDEDHHIHLTYTDKQGRKVADMSYVSLPSANYEFYHATYYVYDDLGHLRVVISPQGSEEALYGYSTGYVDDQLNELLYRYWYNAKGLMTERKIPDKSREYFIYDKKNRLILTSNRDWINNEGKWAFSAYDCFDRVIMTGFTYPWAEPWEVEEYYTNPVYYNSYPDDLYHYLLKDNVYNDYPDTYYFWDDLRVVNYYDNYNDIDQYYQPLDNTDFGSFTGGQYQSSIPVQSYEAKGLLTGQKVRIIDPNNYNAWQLFVNLYDSKGQLIQRKEETWRAYTVTSNQYDFSGDLISSIVKREDYSQYGAHTTKIVKKYEKDYLTGIITGMEQNINNTGFTTIYKKSYDDLGRLASKNLNVTTNNYVYNVRDQLTGINAADINNTSSNKYFHETLSYDEGFTVPSYNGNIAGIKWKNAGSTAPVRAYGYEYDQVNRLKSAEFRQLQDPGLGTWSKIQTDYTVSNIGYDNNGNIYTMNQRGMDNSGNPTTIDQLSYQYKNYSNRLMDVSDAITAPTQNPDFKNQGTSSADYDYDGQGNLTKDLNKNITSITYSELNKPLHIVVNGKGYIDYKYDGLGTKIKKLVHTNSYTSNGNTIPAKDDVTEYEGGFVYHNDTLEYVLHEEGRCRPANPANPAGAFKYDYFIKDHLGNVRATVNAQGNNPPAYYYWAGLELADAATENLVWSNLNDTRVDNPTAPGEKCAELIKSNTINKPVGPATIVRVMTGDRFYAGAAGRAEASGNISVTQSSVLTSLLTALTGTTTGFVGSGAIESQTVQNILQSTNNTALATAYASLQSQAYDPGMPSAYLNYLVFDDNYKLVPSQSGAVQVYGPPDGYWNYIGSNNNNEVKVGQPGYLLVFLSNQSDVAVQFDDIQLNIIRSPIIDQEEHYYPFGLTVSVPSAYLQEQNKYKYNVKELQRNEFANGGGTDWYDYGARMYDQQVARWTSIDPLAEAATAHSPYIYAANNPVNKIDDNGNKDRKFQAGDLEVEQIPGTATLIYSTVNGRTTYAPGYQNAYNCHSYAWHESQGDKNDENNANANMKAMGVLKWDNDPSDDIKEQNAEQLGAEENNIVGDRVIYYYDANNDGVYNVGENIYHSAIVSSVDKDGYTTSVIGKMGQAGISVNHPDAPGYYKTPGRNDPRKLSRAYFRVGKQDDSEEDTPPANSGSENGWNSAINRVQQWLEQNPNINVFYNGF